jgi:hypothetical protein
MMDNVQLQKSFISKPSSLTFKSYLGVTVHCLRLGDLHLPVLWCWWLYFNSEANSINIETISAKILKSQSHVTTDDQSVSKSWFQGPSGSHDQILISVDIYCFIDVWHPF